MGTEQQGLVGSIAAYCPACRCELAPAQGGLHCDSCGTGYPQFGSVQCLLRDPKAYVGQWLSRVHRYCSTTDERGARLLAEAHDPGVAAWLSESLQRLAHALERERTSLVSLFAPLAAVGDPLAPASVITSLVDNPLLVTKYAEHLFRDWVWGDDENQKTLSLVTPLLPESCQRLAVWGAGTGRLALELAQRKHAQEVYALDLNPLPFLVADRLLAGEMVELSEFPLVPLSEECVAVQRQLKFEGTRPEGFRLVLADALDAPFEDRAFDAVLTPWFIDDLPVGVEHTARAVNRALRPGGVWVNVGPLMFKQDSARTCSIERVHEMARQAGFEILHACAQDLAYFASPVSSTRRIDRTYAFAAKKVAEVAAADQPARVDTSPDLTRPVPLTPSLAAAVQRAMMTAGICSLVDGERTLADIAMTLGQHWNVDASEILAPVDELLKRLSS